MTILLVISIVLCLLFAGVFYYVLKNDILPNAAAPALKIGAGVFLVLACISAGATYGFLTKVSRSQDDIVRIATLEKELKEAKGFVTQLTDENEKLIKDREAASEVISSFISDIEKHTIAVGVLKARLAAVSDKQAKAEARAKLEPIVAQCAEPPAEFFTTSLQVLTDAVTEAGEGDR